MIDSPEFRALATKRRPDAIATGPGDYTYRMTFPAKVGTKLFFDVPPAQPQQAVTDAMVSAYLTANDAYWREVDALPSDPTKPWRQGTPKDATRVSLEAALTATPQAAEPTADEYGSTDFGFTFAGIQVSDGGKRLMSMLIRAFGSDHPAVDDLTALLFAAASAPQAAQAQTKPLKRGITGTCTRSTCECESNGLGLECVWLRPSDAEMERRTGEPHIDGWPLYSGLPPAQPQEPPRSAPLTEEKR